MVKGVQVDLTIRDNITGSYLLIPVLPETIPYTDGEKLADSKKILNLGDVDFLNGVALDSMEWTSFFPAKYDPGYCTHSAIKTPLQYKEIFKSWKDSGASLQLICPAAGINTAMTLRTFTAELKGFEGDLYYSVGFKQDKKIRPKQIPVVVNADLTISAANKPTAESRPPVPEKPKPKTYTVKSGDNLTKIAKNLGIASWRTIYDANKSVIGSNPNKIYPGQVLTI